jgi:hypothetical protein
VKSPFVIFKPPSLAELEATRIIMERCNRLQHERLQLLEDEIRRGCSHCGRPMLVDGKPNGIIVYRQSYSLPDIGTPYCFTCCHKVLKIMCEPGDDYAI